MPVRCVNLIRTLFVVLLAAAGVASAGSSSRAAPPAPRVVAQFGGLGNLINGGDLINKGKDVAVKQALSAFGKTLGAQLPIVVAANDAYPTTAKLPGAPFAAAATPNIAVTLRASTDGTIALPPGGYAFPMSVFCMRVSAHSPAAHRYLVAPLHGSAADIITALNSRIPSYAIDHNVLQVLSWDIQAGLPYGSMGREQRAAVDRIIPEYRGRLSGDVYQQMHDEYTRTAASVPGMPSFEGALQGLGPVGAAVVTMQNVRQQLAQPPSTFAQLARSLVPELPAGSVPDRAGDTPWSRYSDRVYVRFTTAGNYATPGTYQVRVLPSSPVASAGPTFALFGSVLHLFARLAGMESDSSDVAVLAPAAVPFGNTVNNPGTDAVQPLTQTPLPPGPGPAPPPTPTPTPMPSPFITSKTVAMVPANRNRTIIGVAEQVELTYSGDSAVWDIAIAHGGRLDARSGKTVGYYAPATQTVETITAHGPRGEFATITFNVIPPSGIIQKIESGDTPLIHSHGVPDIGFTAHIYVQPANVSFQFVLFGELDACGIPTGPFEAQSHHPGGFIKVADVDPVLGSKLLGHDTNFSGSKGHGLFSSAPPAGQIAYQIPWVYKAPGDAQSHFFTTVDFLATFDGKQTLFISKATATATTRLDAPDAGLGALAPGGSSTAVDPCTGQ